MATSASQPARKGARKQTLAATAAAVTKNIIGAVLDKPETVELPQAVSEIHVSPDDVIPAGTVITGAIAAEAGLDDDDIDDLIEAGHVKMVSVYAMAVAEAQG